MVQQPQVSTLWLPFRFHGTDIYWKGTDPRGTYFHNQFLK